MTLCRHCLIDYPASQLLGISGDANQLREAARATGAFVPSLDAYRELVAEQGEAATVRVEPWLSVKLPPSKSRPFTRFFKFGGIREADVADLIATKWDPYCPQLHLMVDELAEKPFFITVAGEVNASKSTFLLGMLAEMLQTARLGPLDELVPTVRPSQLDEVRQQIQSVYSRGDMLPTTTADEVKDGFVVRLAVEGEPDSWNLGFIDVPGEVIRDEAKSAKSAKFIYRSDAIILLLDPRAFPRKGSFMVSSTDGIVVVSPDIINSLAEGITKVRGKSPAGLDIPFVLAVAKSDLVTDWPEIPETDGNDPIADLRTESAVIRKFLMDREMSAIVRTAEVTFGKQNVYYTRLSALGGDVGSKNVVRQPIGCWKPLALVLAHAGFLDTQRDA